MGVQKIPFRGQTVGEEVVAAKSRRKDMAVAAAVAAVLAAVFVAFCVLTAVLAEEARAVGAVIWGAGAVAMAVLAVMYGKKARRIAALPQGIIVFTGEKLRICAKEGTAELRPKDIARVEEKPMHSRYKTFDRGDLLLTCKDGRVLTVENVGSLGAAKQRLIELKTAEEIAGTPVRG